MLRILLLVIFLCSFGYPAKAMDVIINDSVAIQSLSTSDVRRIFSMRQKYWQQEQTIVVFVLPSKTNTHQKFCKSILKLFPYQLDRIWHKLVYSGVGVAPIEVDSEAKMLQAVANTPGAIGYIENANLIRSVHKVVIKGAP